MVNLMKFRKVRIKKRFERFVIFKIWKLELSWLQPYRMRNSHSFGRKSHKDRG